MGKKLKSKIYAILYIVLVVVANLVTIFYKPTILLGLVVPPSSWFMGFTFLLINLISKYESKRFTGSLIWIGLGLTSLICFVQSLPQSIVVASGLAFVISQWLSNFLFKYWRRKSVGDRIAVTPSWINPSASFIGSTVDATIWIILGLSPLGIGSVSWGEVPLAVLGQVIVQGILQLIANKFLQRAERKKYLGQP